MAWDETDQAKAIAFAVEKGARCVMCGTAPWEWDPVQGGRKNAYEAVEEFCMGCYLKAGASRDLDSGDGRTVTLLPTTGREAAQRHVAAKKAYHGRHK